MWPAPGTTVPRTAAVVGLRNGRSVTGGRTVAATVESCDMSFPARNKAGQSRKWMRTLSSMRRVVLTRISAGCGSLRYVILRTGVTNDLARLQIDNSFGQNTRQPELPNTGAAISELSRARQSRRFDPLQRLCWRVAPMTPSVSAVAAECE